MTDHLFSRAQLAIDESLAQRRHRRALQHQAIRLLEELRLAILTSAMTRSEIKAFRDDGQAGRGCPNLGFVNHGQASCQAVQHSRSSISSTRFFYGIERSWMFALPG